jgi:predicted dehydrogenase
MSDAIVKAGVIGVGSLGQWHARVYSELDNAELVGVYDINPDRAQEIAERYHTRAFSDMNELADIAEALSIAVPTHLHYDVACNMLDKGIHLLVEKPITDNLAHAESLVELARARQCVLQVGHVERFNPVMSYLEAQLDKPNFIEAIRLAPFPAPRPGLHPRGTEVSVIFDLMIHDLEIILHLVNDEIERVDAVGVPVLSPSEDIANARILFKNGCVANVTASRVSQESLRKIRVFQSDTYLSLDYQGQTGQLIKKTESGIEKSDVPIEKEEPLKNELLSFITCVQNGHEPKVSGEHASRALELASEICQLTQKSRQ